MGVGSRRFEAVVVVVMLMMNYVGVFWCGEVEGGGGGGGQQQLSYGFYDKTCPQVETIVALALHSITLSDPTSPPALLRLMFHDCQVQGCDASILIDATDAKTPTEMDSSRNFGVRKRESIDIIKSMVEAVCPQQVSCTDILILAAREAVAVAGGPRIEVPLGRRDSTSPPSNELADASLPPASVGVDGTLKIFADKGMNVEEAVAIMGAHTLGVTHCLNIKDRLYSPEEAAGEMEPGFRTMLRLSCPLTSFTPNATFVLNDPTTLTFDNQYYANSMSGRGVLGIDAELALDPRTAPFVQSFADDQERFFQAFSSAFVKLSASGVLTGDQGVIRQTCNALS